MKVVQEAIARADVDVGPASDALSADPANQEASATQEASSFDPAARGPKPRISPSPTIDELSARKITEMVDWVMADGRLRTHDELTAEVARELGFQRLGTKIRERLGAVIRGRSA